MRSGEYSERSRLMTISQPPPPLKEIIALYAELTIWQLGRAAWHAIIVVE